MGQVSKFNSEQQGQFTLHTTEGFLVPRQIFDENTTKFFARNVAMWQLEPEAIVCEVQSVLDDFR